MTYPLPTSENVNMSKGLGEVLNYTNDITYGWLMNMILIAVYIIIIISYYRARNDFAGAMATSGFVTFLIALMFWAGGIISGTAFAFVVGVAIVGIIILLVENK